MRITYKKLTQAIDQWNADNTLVYKDKGFLLVGNDGNVHWLQQIMFQGTSAVKKCNLPTNGTCRSCYEHIRFVEKP